MVPPPSPKAGPLTERKRRPLVPPVSVVTPVGEFELVTGSILVGRLADCHIRLTDELVSRMHARLSIVGNTVVAEDLHSANGVYIDGLRVAGTRVLCDGDRILMGTSELSLFEIRDSSVMKVEPVLPSVSQSSTTRAPPVGPFSLPPEARPRPSVSARRDEPPASLRMKPTQTTQPTIPPLSSRPPVAAPHSRIERIPSTARASAVKMVGLLAERLAESGDIDEAVYVLSGQLRRILQGTNAGLPVPTDVAELASHYALQLARWSGQTIWVDYVVELHLSARLLMSSITMPAFEAALLRVLSYDRLLLGYYVTALRNRAHEFSPEQLTRVERLARFANPV